MKKMDAKEFLKTLDLPKRSRGEDESDITWLYYEKGVVEAMEKYHQSKVNNSVLDSVSNSYCRACIEDTETDMVSVCKTCGSIKK